MASVPPAAAGVGDAVLSIDGRLVARRLFVSCLVAEVGFVLLDYHINYGRLTDIGALRRLANIAREDGLASWFAATQTLLVGLTAWVFWTSLRARYADPWRRAGWLLVAVLFTYMAMDDGVQLHERVGTAFAAVRSPGSPLFPSFSWQPLFVPVLAVAGALAAMFLWRELRGRWARGLVAVAFVLLGAAVGLDFLEGLAPDHPWNLYSAVVTRYDIAEFTRVRFRQSPYETVLHFSRSLEEFSEMLATTCLWTALVAHAGAALDGLRLRASAGEHQPR